MQINKSNPNERKNKKENKPFSESRRAGFLFILVALLLIFLPFILWGLQPYHKLHVWILDKTVPTQEYREHRGVMWALNYFRITDKVIQNTYYKYNRDYFGFFPLTPKKYEVKDLVNAAPNPDLILLADTYGVYTDDYWEPNERGTRSELIYGGLTLEDIFMLRTNLKDNVTLMASFNTIATPTEESVRKKAEEILGVEWKEWMGRFFLDLDREKEVAVWMVKNWEEQHNATWNFTGPGFVLCSNWDQVEVMEESVHFNEKDIWFQFLDAYTEEFNSKTEISYYYWFDFIRPMEGTEILAEYTMDVTEKGDKFLQSLGLNSTFPAITRKKNEDYTAYYMAGDFEDHKASSVLWHVYGLDTVRKWFSLDFRGESHEYYWKGYLPFVKKVFSDVVKERETYTPPKKEETTYQENETHFISKTNKMKFMLYSNGAWVNYFVKGVNMGMALPGHWFTQFPKDEDVYYEWFKGISEMNANTVRTYTLIDPAFYRALYLYNMDHPTSPIYLLQGIWPEEHPLEDNYWGDEYRQSFMQEIRWGVDAIHGNVTIPERTGRAYGRYIANVSDWTIGYLVGRELEAKEVEANNTINAGKRFNGKYIGVNSKANPTEAWIAWACDSTVAYEMEAYQWQRPVSIVSWPTLDVTEHESEWSDLGDKSNQFNDLEVVDIRNFIIKDQCKAGFFGTYHIYPNYPDFMNNEIIYEDYFDENGSFMYGGYLQEFMETHTGYPALVGEFGMATGMGTAHENPTGLHHGGVTEIEQGEMTVRMMKAIKSEQYIGGCVFEWMDEWAKKTWTTESFMIPYEHHVYWHNVICPEQNYGIVANETKKPDTVDMSIRDTKGYIEQLDITHDASYLYLDFLFSNTSTIDQYNINIGIDTYERTRGNYRYSPYLSLNAPSGMEFMIRINNQKGLLLVNPSYNIGELSFSSQLDYSGIYEHINPIINKSRITKYGRVIPEIRDDGSTLRYGDFVGSTNHFYYENSHLLHVRIPWGRLNVTDPTSRTVLDDIRKYNYYPPRDTFSTKVSTGFLITTVLQNKAGNVIDIFPGFYENADKYKWDTVPSYAWKTWTWATPPYVQRLKKSYYIIQDYFAK